MQPLNMLVLIFYRSWIESKIKSIEKEYKTVEQARLGLQAKLKDSRNRWIPGVLRKRVSQWIDRMAQKSATIDELVDNMDASLSAGLADVAAGVHG